MKKRFFIVIAVASILFVGCTGGNNKKASSSSSETEKTEETEYDMHNAENSLDYYGIYKGVMPAVDFEGTEVTITLNFDNTFAKQSLLLNENKDEQNDKGNFKLEENLLSLYFENGNIEYYMVGEGSLRKLDDEKKDIEGEDADKYILSQEEIFER